MVAVGPILRERRAGQHVQVEVSYSDSDEAEEWVATDEGGFDKIKERTPKPKPKPAPEPELPPANGSKKRALLGKWAVTRTSLVLAAAALALAVGVQRTELFWCGARGIPLGSLFRAPGFALQDVPDLTGQTVLITGANTGLGLAVAMELAHANASVVLACRNTSKCEDAASSVRAVGGAGAEVRAVALDLNDLENVEHAAAKLRRELRALHVLINNAGVASQFPSALTTDGVERTFQANYLGHFALTMRMLPVLEATAKREHRPTRVVHLTSGAHRGAPAEGVPLELAAINGPMGAFARYGMAKLASLAFSNELARRHAPHVLSNAVHPGVVATEMLRRDNFVAMLGRVVGSSAWLAAKARNALFAYSARTAALTVLYPAVAKEVRAGGELYVPIATRWAPHHPLAVDEQFGAALWEFSDRLVSEAQRRARSARPARPEASETFGDL